MQHPPKTNQNKPKQTHTHTKKKNHATQTNTLTNLCAIAAGQVIQRCLDGIRGVQQHTRSDSGLTHVDHEEVDGGLRRAHLGWFWSRGVVRVSGWKEGVICTS